MLINHLTLNKKFALNPSYSDASCQFACLHVSVNSFGVNSPFSGHGETTHKISPLLLHATSFKFYLPLDVPRKSVHTSYKSAALHNVISPLQVVMPIRTRGKCTVVDSQEHLWPWHAWRRRSHILRFLWYMPVNFSYNILGYCSYRGGVRSTRGLGPTMTARGLGPTMRARGQSIGISIGMLPQTLIISRLDQLSRFGARI